MYCKQVSSANPGLVIILVDQSASMIAGRAELAASIVNMTIENIVSSCSNGDSVKDRFQIAVIGYSTKAEVLFLEKLSELSKNPKTSWILKEVANEKGEIMTSMEVFREWILPKSNGGKAMSLAFAEAKKGVRIFLKNNPDSFPPLVINVTSDNPYETYDYIKIKEAANKLSNIKTNDGNVIIANVYISINRYKSLKLLPSNQEYNHNPYENCLFEISSEFPDSLFDISSRWGFNEVEHGAKCFFNNTDVATFIRLYTAYTVGS